MDLEKYATQLNGLYLLLELLCKNDSSYEYLYVLRLIQKELKEIEAGLDKCVK